MTMIPSSYNSYLKLCIMQAYHVLTVDNNSSACIPTTIMYIYFQFVNSMSPDHNTHTAASNIVEFQCIEYSRLD